MLSSGLRATKVRQTTQTVQVMFNDAFGLDFPTPFNRRGKKCAFVGSYEQPTLFEPLQNTIERVEQVFLGLAPTHDVIDPDDTI